MHPQTLDDLFTRTPNTTLSDLTAQITRTHGEGVTLATHCGKFYSSIHTVEARFTGVEFLEWAERKATMAAMGTEYCIIRRDPQPTHTQRLAAIHTMDVQTGRAPGARKLKYSKTELILQALDHWRHDLTGKPSFAFRRLGEIVPSMVICSKSAALIDISVGMLPPRTKYFSPDGLWDLKYGGGLGQHYNIVEMSLGWRKMMEAANLPIKFTSPVPSCKSS